MSISDTRTDLSQYNFTSAGLTKHAIFARRLRNNNQYLIPSTGKGHTTVQSINFKLCLGEPEEELCSSPRSISTTHVRTVPAKAYISSSSSSSSIRFFSSGGAEWLEPIIGTVLKHLSAYVSLRTSENDSDRIRSGCSRFIFLHSFDSIHNLLTRDKFEKKV